MRQQAQPAAQQRIDPAGIQRVCELLQASWVAAGQDAIVQGHVVDRALAELALEPLVPVLAQLAGVREVGAELEKERAEVAVDAVEVVVVDQSRGPDDPGVRSARVGISSTLGAKHPSLLLSLADEQDAFISVEPSEMLLHHVILALTFGELDESNLLLLDESFDAAHEAERHRGHQRRRGETLASVMAEERRRAGFGLQLGLVPVPEKQPDAQVAVLARSTDSAVAERAVHFSALDARGSGEGRQRSLAVAAEGSIRSAFDARRARGRVLVLSSAHFFTNPLSRAGNGPPLSGQFRMFGDVGGDQRLKALSAHYARTHLTRMLLVAKNALDWGHLQPDAMSCAALMQYPPPEGPDGG